MCESAAIFFGGCGRRGVLSEAQVMRRKADVAVLTILEASSLVVDVASPRLVALRGAPLLAEVACTLRPLGAKALLVDTLTFIVCGTRAQQRGSVSGDLAAPINPVRCPSRLRARTVTWSPPFRPCCPALLIFIVRL